ncbi:hypothetical protein KCN56_08915 [Photobacterium galatheae]|uniref:hypothetical protein n=1 Tax=Photobacterium galatheae TaxID=1654360 RepID=UPI00202CD3C8|nr:hypothetical protein [Photobacterium galatheae]MCM0148678.1 hypothetical protein [Photobacterium galatheae]
MLSIGISVEAYADDINQYRYYQIWQGRPSGADKGSVFIKKDDLCITVYNKRENSQKRYCQMGSSQLNSEKEYPTTYPTMMSFDGAILYFYVAAPWNEQKCSIDLLSKEIQCEATGQ